MTQADLIIRFDGDGNLAGRALDVQELAEFIREDAHAASIERQRDDPSAQDLGAVLGIVLGSAALVQVAKGINRWLGKRTSATLTVTGKNGSFTITGLTCGDAASLGEKLVRIHGLSGR